MRLISKQLNTPGLVRSMYVAVPDSDPKTLWKPSSITILRDQSSESSVHEIIKSTGLDKMIDEEGFIVLFPDPTESGWNFDLYENGPRDAEFICAIQETLNSGLYTDGWRIINDVHYLIGFGRGGSMVHTLAAVFPSPSLAAAICTVGGTMTEAILEKASNVAVPAMLFSSDGRSRDYFLKANGADKKVDTIYINPVNPFKKVFFSNAPSITPEIMKTVWHDFFSRIRRINTSPTGDVDRRIIPSEYGFVWHVNDTRLGDNGGISHDWLEHIPSCVRENPDKKVPLVIFSHGMSDSPLKAADMSKFHELGEKEGFITVYPFSSDRYKWNLSLDENLYSDVDYFLALIRYLVNTYPIDERRIYTSGFSNGAGMAMLFAMLHPEIVAATCPIDSTFPYAVMRNFRPSGTSPFLSPVLKEGESAPKVFMPKEDPEKNLAPLNMVLERQKTKAYRMPVMYFYGTREGEYPIRSGSNQELTYNFWKRFNNIDVKPTVDDLEPEAVGVAGDRIEKLNPCPEHPDHTFTKHTFYSNDPSRDDYYHFVLMHGKAHDVHPSEARMGWEFVSRFSRNPDGSLTDALAKE